jgi:hypothetical protein
VVGEVAGTTVHLIGEGATCFICAPQIMAKIPRIFMEVTEAGGITDTAGVEATISNRHIHRGPLTRRLSNSSMEVTADTVAAGLLQDGPKIMVAMDLAVVLLHPEVAPLITALHMDKATMADMERLIIMVMVVMADMVLIMGTGIKAEVEEVHRTPYHVEEAGLGSY